jgi:ABC-type Fe3+ transport system permease subunit
VSDLPPPPPGGTGWGTPPSPPPGYGAAPGYGYGYPAPPKTNGYAIAALICGICSFAVCGLAALAGIPLGIVALRQIKESQGAEQGRGMALAGVWVSVAYLVVVVLVVIGFIVLVAVADPPQDDFEPYYFPTTSTTFELPTTSTSVPR